jgi:hypothetical protein
LSRGRLANLAEKLKHSRHYVAFASDEHCIRLSDSKSTPLKNQENNQGVVMATLFEMRREASRLARDLRASLLGDDAKWTIDRDFHDGAALTSGKLHITVAPRLIRVLDRIHLYCDGTEVWLPLVSRIRLRGAVRLLAARHARTEWQRQTNRNDSESRARSA